VYHSWNADVAPDMTTDIVMFGLDTQGPALDGSGWCCFL
jgi:hypothetical protein